MQPRTSNLEPRSLRSDGFTLIELAVVVAILGMVALLVFPRLPSVDAARLRGSARSLAATLRYLEDRAVTTKTGYTLSLNLTEGAVTVMKRLPGGEQVPPDESPPAGRALAEGVSIEDVFTPRSGKRSTGEVSLEFGPGGLQEFAAIHLKSERGGQYTVMAYPASGKVRVFDGYREEAL